MSKFCIGIDLGGDFAELGKDVTQGDRSGGARAQRKVDLAVERVQLFAHGGGLGAGTELETMRVVTHFEPRLAQLRSPTVHVLSRAETDLESEIVARVRNPGQDHVLGAERFGVADGALEMAA